MWTYVQTVIIYTFVLGSIYLLIALGFSLICGVLRIFHLGYAYIFPLTVYGTWMFMSALGWSLIPSILGMVVIQFVVSVLIYKGIIKKYLTTEDVLLTALLLVALIVEQAANYFYPVQAGVYLDTTLMDGIFQVGEVVVPKQLVIGAVIALVMTGAFVVFFVKTKTGMAIRALSQDIYSSKIVGINVESLYVFTMMIVLLPVIIGMLIVAPVWSVEPGMGWLYMTTAILVSVLGGLGNIKGTIMASFLIGFTHAIVCNVIGEPRFMNLSALILVMIALVIRPQGLARSESLW
ncbi:MAG TPA: branched-chain amino acid ABC transporter permease [Smithellaceae bacterium]|jgi:branched-chain amino acid transport system permease protein|nr:branched-chain amino acid ABC transporter permease [Smithellaceae bacterium]HOG82022.1 branched-chain amino acid ABC transporter permease [Smithellaceae bacterium]HOQ41653.1 branched-chain amino acid ABC transporter permease [Smithellaceae bacterium]HPL66029.1 branched-chain amino acid ABC transporter permease [Smithellaceae bacterium]